MRDLRLLCWYICWPLYIPVVVFGVIAGLISLLLELLEFKQWPEWVMIPTEISMKLLDAIKPKDLK